VGEGFCQEQWLVASGQWQQFQLRDIMADDSNPVQADSPEVRRYNRIRRWLGIADFLVGFAFLIVLLVTRWSGWAAVTMAYRLGLSELFSVAFHVPTAVACDQQSV